MRIPIFKIPLTHVGQLIKKSNRTIITTGHLKVDLLKDNELFPGIFEDDEDAFDDAEEVASTNNRKVRSVGNDNSEVELVEIKENDEDIDTAQQLSSDDGIEKIPHTFKTKTHSPTEAKPRMDSENAASDAKLPNHEAIPSPIEGNSKGYITYYNF